MKATAKTLAAIAALCVAAAPTPSLAETVTSDAALAAAKGWVNLRQSMDGGAFSAPESAKAYSGADGKGTYYVVSLSGGGYVVTSGDTFLKPVLSYAASGAWEENEAKNPLVLFVKCDVAASAAAIPEAGSAVASANAAEWAKLAAAQKGGARRLAATAPTADLRVAPLLTTAWNQGNVDGKLCYNYYTPNNYLCGCAATALAQVMKYFRYPTGKVTAGEGYYDSVNYGGTDKGWNMDGYFASATATTKTPWSPAFGGPYNWDAMVDAPTGSTSETARKAIGQLCRDAAITVFSHFNVNNSGETSGFSGTQASALVKTFGFAGATASPYNENALLASLDAGLPAVMELSGNGGHGVVADGYGYDDGGTLYVHFNFGWGDDNSGRWYTPPNVQNFTSIQRMTAAIFTPAQGTRGSSVISGRVLDANGAPVSGATVTAKNALGTAVATKTSNAKGIYAFIIPAGSYLFTAESGSDKGERLCTVEPTASPLRPDSGWGGESTVNHSRSGIDLAFGQTTGLMHRWSFTSDYTDAKGTADGTASGSGVSISDGKAVLSGGNNAGYVNLGTGVLGDSDATLEIWFEKLANPASWACAFSYGADGSNKFYVNTAYGYNDEFGGNTGSSFAPVGITIGGTGYGLKEGLEPLLPNLPQHISVTFKKNSDGSTAVRFMSRDAVTGFLLREYAKTIPSWTLADASDFVLALGQETAGTYHIKSQFDEVRVWKGVLSDEQLSANVLAGPDAPLGDGSPVVDSAEGIVVMGGETFAVPTATGGYGYWTDKKVALGSGAKIRFDTTGYFGKALRFRTGGFILPSGSSSPLDFVELSDSENYTAAMEDANTVLVQLKPTVPYESTWSGGTPATAADLANAANWTSVNAQGDAVAAAPTAKTTAIIPASSLAAFTLPAGASVGWGRTILGGHSGTQWGKIASTGGNNNWITFRERVLADYTANGAKEVSYLNRTNSNNHPSELGGSQLRFDGWINVSAAQAGRWNIRCNIDDMIAFAIDGDWQFMHNTWRYGVTAGCYVSEGWHRFTLIVRDTGGGFGMSTALNGTNYPFVLSVNGGEEIGFSQLTFGSGTASVALSGDADWRILGAITLESGLTIDLNGHNLRFATITATSVGARLTNSSATTSSLLGDFDASNVIVDGNIFLKAAELTHRWSFNGLTDGDNLVDSVGKVVAEKDSSLISWNGKSMVMAGNGSEGSYGLILGRGLLDAKAATIEIWATQHEIRNWNALFEYAVDTTDNVRWRLNYGTRDYQQSIGAPGVDKPDNFRNTLDEPAHFSVTFAENGAGTFVRFMRRHAKTGAIEYECSGTTTKSIADFDNPYFIVGGTMWKDKTANAEFDEIRLWKGVLSDAQLAASVLAGPNTVLGDGAAPAGEADRLVLASGDVFVVPTTGGGYGFWTDKKVVLNNGAKIRFTTADYFGTGLRFRTGGFVMASGATDPRTFVELDDTTNYNLEMEDENTILVRLKDALPHTSTWIGGVPSSSADFANASNWTSVNAKGETVSAAPCAKTTAIIPAASLAAFTMPSGATATWGRTILGGHSAVRYGYKDGSPASVRNAWRDLALSSYTTIGEVPGGADGIELFTGGGNTPADLATAQMRLDGWFYVTAAQAGFWRMPNAFDDVLSFAIDGEWVLLNSTYRFTNGAGAYVSEGWHRFTLAAGETGGGWGSAYSINGVKVPFVVSINGGANIRFSPDNFTFGSDATSVTLSGDADWTGLGPVFMENGLVVDLDGHSLSVAGLDGNFVSATLKNTSATASTLTTYSGAVGTGVITDNITISSLPPVEAYWTGAGGTGLANDHRNWNCYSAANKSGLLPGALPMSSTLVVMDTAPASTVVDGDVLNWYQMKLGSAGKGYLAIEEGGSLSTVNWGTVGLTKNYSGQIDQTGGSLRSGAEFSVGENGTGVYNQSGGSSYYSGTLYIGRNSNAGVGTYNLSGGSLETSGSAEFQVGSSGKGTFNQTAGSVRAGNWFSIGRVAGTGVYNISGGSLTVSKTDRPLWLGGDNASGVGTLNISGTAVVNFNGGVDAGRNNQSHGYLNQDGGSLTVSNGDGFNIARDSYATYVQNAGDLVVNCVTRLAWGNGSTVGGTYKLNGGTATFKNDFYVGAGRLGTFAQSGGTMTANNGVKIANGSSATGYFNMSGGILNTPSIQGVSGVASVVLDGGTIVAKNASDGAFFSGIDSLVVGGGAIDTDGHDLSVTADAVKVIDGGKTFTKAGEGTLTFPAMPASDTVTVEAGALALAVGANNVAPAAPALTGPTHRWSFNNSYNDSVTGAAPASRFGTTSGKTTPLTITPGKLVLNGGGGWGNGSLSLGVSSLGSADATVEIWAGNDAIVNNSVLFSYSDQNWGTAPQNEVCFKWSEGTAATDVMWVKKAGTDIFKENAVLSQVVLGKEYYFAFTFHDNGDGSTLISWQRRDAATGALERSGRRVVPGWTLANVASSTNPTFAIGVYKNNVAGDAKASYNEVRVWGAALSDDALALSAQKGPDATAADIAAIVAKNGEVADRTLAVASGATLDLGGNTLTQPVIAGAGTVQNGTLTVTKKICVNAGEKLTFSGVALDVTGTTVEVADPENLAQSFVFAQSTTAITGMPSSGVRGWKVKKSADGRTLTFKRVRGTMVIVN